MKHKTKKGCKSTRKRKGMKTRRVHIQRGGVRIKHPMGEFGEYEGHVDKDGQPQGHGTVTWDDRIMYEGDFKDGLAHGRGKVT